MCTSQREKPYVTCKLNSTDCTNQKRPRPYLSASLCQTFEVPFLDKVCTHIVYAASSVAYFQRWQLTNTIWQNSGNTICLEYTGQKAKTLIFHHSFSEVNGSKLQMHRGNFSTFLAGWLGSYRRNCVCWESYSHWLEIFGYCAPTWVWDGWVKRNQPEMTRKHPIVSLHWCLSFNPYLFSRIIVDKI